ncbi:endo-beta-N-acetylglucosaminidase H [Austwickia chelonae]|uniref:endo-beta-N-acetylglucosaminidase H n=1 Tax=Austwickia chelonae TaxID=100225 RepID=UPI000E23669C|nr:endo-beta-N-acetylglucosaminidase H [Austwickia chelonae]
MAARHDVPAHPRYVGITPPPRFLAALMTAFLVVVGAIAAPGPAQAASPRKHKSIVYVEVNSNELANAGKYRLADGTNVFDIAIIFAANINTGSDGNAKLHLNDKVQRTLDNADTQIRPLQRHGTKVTLSLLGNHQKSGFANFPTREAADQYAAQVAQVVKQYGLDGVDIDDEWVKYGSNGVPAANGQSAIWLVEALHAKLPQGSIISLYNIGPAAGQLAAALSKVTDKITYICNPHYGTYAPPSFNVDKSRLGAAAVDLNQTGKSRIRELAQSTVRDGYGYFVTYDLTAGDHSATLSTFTEKLYGQRAVHKG